MGEKFKKSFYIPDGQHSDSSPIVIQQGYVLTSNDSDKVVAQVVLKNICPKPIDSASIKVYVYNNHWEQEGNAIDAVLRGSGVGREELFGSNQVVPLPSRAVKAISVHCDKVKFTDGSEWNAPKTARWKPLKADLKTPAEVLDDGTLADQFVYDMKEKSIDVKNYPCEQNGLWYCACGTQNTPFDETCHNCGIAKDELFSNATVEVLTEHKEAAIAAQEAAEQLAREEKDRKKKKAKKIAFLSVGAVALTLLTIFFIIPFIKYSIADSNVTKSDYASAIAYYEELDDFMDSQLHCAYAKALKQVQDGEIEEGIRALLEQNVAVNLSYTLNNGTFVNSKATEEAQFLTKEDFSGLEKLTRDYYDFGGYEPLGEIFDPKKPESAAVTVGAVFTPTEYKIKYETDGEMTNPNPSTFNYESESISLKAPSRVGYTFVSWQNEAGENVNSNGAIPAKSHGNKTFKATWNPNVYTITIEPGEEQPAKGFSFENTKYEFTFDAEFALPKAEKRGHTFLGWKNEKGTFLEGIWTVAEDVILKPEFELTTYSLSYNLQGGELATKNPEKYNMETPAITLNNPTRFGYKFTGWTWENQKSATTNAVLNPGDVGDKHFVAHWQGNPHTVTLDAAGGSVSTTSVAVTYGSDYSLPTPTKTGYVFNGWVSGGKTYGSGKWSLDKNITVTASWTAKQYSIKLNAAGGNCSSSAFTATYDSNYTLPTPTRRGYTFLGWYYNGVKFTGGKWNTDAAITLTASWKGNSYTVFLNGNGGSVSKSSISVVFGDSYSIPTPTKNGYDFTGWSTSSYPSYYASKFPSSGIWTTDGNVTLYAQWELHKYTLTIDPNGGSFSGSRTRSVTYGSSVYLGSSYRTGYEFDGWYYGGTELGYSSFTYDFEDDITVKARWTPETYSVRLNANGGSGVPSSYTLTYGERYSLPTPTRDGYTFDGWYTSSYGGSRFSSSGIWESTSNPYSLYARWTAAPAPTTTP